MRYRNTDRKIMKNEELIVNEEVANEMELNLPDNFFNEHGHFTLRYSDDGYENGFNNDFDFDVLVEFDSDNEEKMLGYFVNEFNLFD